jgi:hypothetical protein
MNEQEFPAIQITEGDISEANRLSLHCPICAGAVESNLDGLDLQPVVCAQCGTLYHKACWEQSGGKCAILGCDHQIYRIHGQSLGPALKVDYRDIKEPATNGRGPSQQTKRLKYEQQRQVEQLRRPSFLQRLWQWLLDQIRFE